MKKLISFFSSNHILTNMLVIFIFASVFYFWVEIPKEEIPEMTVDKVIVMASYSGAGPSDVEYFVTKEIEEAVIGIEGVDSISSNSNNGSCTVVVSIEAGYSDYDQAVSDIEDAVDGLKLPEEVTDDPIVRELKSTNKPIMDIAIFHQNEKMLTDSGRQELQDVVHALENQLQALGAVNEVSHSGYLDEEVNIFVDPDKLALYNISYSKVISSLRSQNVRLPVGKLEGEDDARVTVQSELDTIEKLEKAVIQSSFSGRLLRVEDVAEVSNRFEEINSITKTNGHQGIILTLRKNSSVGILEASDEIRALVDRYFATSLKDSPISYIIFEDESTSVRDRLSLIGWNGVLGFFLILISLFFFLNFKSGVWVAVGIPFSIAFTLGGLYFIGYSINNMTLAGVIIVLGMVVDDAIVIAENITRRQEMGESRSQAVVNGTSVMIRPVLASILTTCAAFIPLFFFSNFIGKMIGVIPAVIFFMLGASFLEALFILPSHMNMHFPFHFKRKKEKKKKERREHWFMAVEKVYGRILFHLLRFRWFFYVLAILLLTGAMALAFFGMRFELFPREESTRVVVMGMTKPGTSREDTELAVRSLEGVLDSYIDDGLEIYTTRIASSRRGNDTNENEFSIMMELVPADQRELSTVEISDAVMADFEPFRKQFMKLNLGKRRFGPQGGSGSPLELQILDNNDERREALAQKIVDVFNNHPELQNGEIESQLKKKQYQIEMKRDLMQRLSINPSEVATVLRTIVDGSTLFYHYRDDVEIPVQVTVRPDKQQNMMQVIQLPVSNQRSYLVPLSEIVEVIPSYELNSIKRYDEKRVLTVYADFVEGSKVSPLDIASWMEAEIFPDLLSQYPASVLQWTGEVKQTRESGKDFLMAVLMVVVLIFFILALLFRSLLKPFLIMISIPFGAIGVVFALYLHGITSLGLFTVIGMLGLAGVVVNDSIVMLAMLQEHSDDKKFGSTLLERIARVASTRLRAVLLTTITTVAGLIPTAYGFMGYDSMLSDMMLAMSWGLIFGTLVTLVLIPMLYYSYRQVGAYFLIKLQQLSLYPGAKPIIHDDVDVEKEKGEISNV